MAPNKLQSIEINRLDTILKEIWPELESHLKKTGYIYSPISAPHIETELSHKLVRSMTTMLFDEQKAICRVILNCTPEHWMIENEFFLTLPSNVDFKFIIEILGNSRLSGNPPSLIISKNNPTDFFQITFNSGNGEDWNIHDTVYLIDRLKKSVDVNIDLFEIMVAGEVNEEIVAEFLTKAYEIYEAF